MDFLFQEAVELDLIHFSAVKGIVTFPLNDSSFLSSILTGQMEYFKDCFWKSGQWKIPESLPLLFLVVLEWVAFDFSSRFIKMERDNNFTYFPNHNFHLQRIHMLLKASEMMFFHLTATNSLILWGHQLCVNSVLITTQSYHLTP